MWFGNSLIRIGICCNSEMLGLMAGGVFWWLCIVSALFFSSLHFYKRESG